MSHLGGESLPQESLVEQTTMATALGEDAGPKMANLEKTHAELQAFIVRGWVVG